MIEHLAWRKSRASGTTQSECVEVACVSDATLIRDSKYSRGRWLAIPRDAWGVFLANLASDGNRLH